MSILDSNWISEVNDIRSFMDEDYDVPLGGGGYSRTTMGKQSSQLAWARIGIEKFVMRVIPQIIPSGNDVKTNSKIINYLSPYIRKACKDAVVFGNSTILLDTASGMVRVSTPETSCASIDPFGHISFEEQIYNITNFSYYDGGDNRDFMISCVDDDDITDTTVKTFTIFYGADGAHRYGSSRISPSVRSSIRAASRNKIRAEIASNFYAYPQRVINGAWEEMDPSIMNGAKAMASGAATIQILPKDPSTGETLEYKQLDGTDFTPFINMQEQLATEVAIALGINLDELGVVKTGSATSADGIYASHEAISVEIEAWEQSITKTLQDFIDAYTDSIGVPYATLTWREPAQPSKASAADAAIKLVSAFPALADSPAVLKWAGLPNDVLRDISNELNPIIISDDENGGD